MAHVAVLQLPEGETVKMRGGTDSMRGGEGRGGGGQTEEESKRD